MNDYRIATALFLTEATKNTDKIEEVHEYMDNAIYARKTLHELYTILNIPGLHYALGIVGPVGACLEMDDGTLTVTFRLSEKGEYTIVKVADDKFTYGEYAVGIFGEFFDANVLEAKNDRSDLLLASVMRNDEIALFAIDNVIDEVVLTILDLLAGNAEEDI